MDPERTLEAIEWRYLVIKGTDTPPPIENAVRTFMADPENPRWVYSSLFYNDDGTFREGEEEVIGEWAKYLRWTFNHIIRLSGGVLTLDTLWDSVQDLYFEWDNEREAYLPKIEPGNPWYRIQLGLAQQGPNDFYVSFDLIRVYYEMLKLYGGDETRIGPEQWTRTHIQEEEAKRDRFLAEHWRGAPPPRAQSAERRARRVTISGPNNLQVEVVRLY